MFRRLFWLLMGVGFGFGTSFWVMRFVKETAARYSPERVSNDLADVASDRTADLSDVRNLSPLLHAVLAVALLLVAVVLAVYKPRGLTPYGRRRRSA